MDIFKFLLSIEEFIYEILLGILFIPKTLYKIILHPSWAYNYIDEELKKEGVKRFDAYLSPILLFAVVVIVPFSCCAFSPLHIVINAYDGIKKVLDGNLQLTILCIGIDLLAFPLVISYFINRKGKKEISKSELKPTLYMQCYAFVPPQILSLIFCYLMIVKGYAFTATFWFIISATIIPVFWLIWRIAAVTRLQLSVGRGKALRLALLYYIITAGILYSIMFLFFKLIA